VTVVLRSRADLDLETYRRVAWGGEPVELAPEAVARIADCRRSFLALVDSDPNLVVYGVTSGYGERARIRLSADERRAQASWPPRWADASFGEPMPERLVRGIVLARLVNFLEGHAAVRPELAEAVAGMLDGTEPLPAVALQGNGDSGEIVALSRLFGDLGERVGPEEKEALALINGSPCAAAALADAALAGRNRLRLAHEIFALSVEALAAPLEAYAPELEELWGDVHETRALQTLRGLLEQSPIADRRPYQAPVSYRILPRVFGEAHRALEAVEEAAETSLRSVSDNPVYIPPDGEHPLGRVWSTGGYHNGMAYPALDRLAATWANLCQLADRHGERLVHDANPPPSDTHHGLGVLLMVLVGAPTKGGRPHNRRSSPAAGSGRTTWALRRSSPGRRSSARAALSTPPSPHSERSAPRPCTTPGESRRRRFVPCSRRSGRRSRRSPGCAPWRRAPNASPVTSGAGSTASNIRPGANRLTRPRSSTLRRYQWPTRCGVPSPSGASGTTGTPTGC
jgi:histidine ammonia-lyase